MDETAYGIQFRYKPDEGWVWQFDTRYERPDDQAYEFAILLDLISGCASPAVRAVRCKAWRWLPGMLTLESPDSWVMRPADTTEIAMCDADADTYPDLSDPATLGCLLALVREAWGDRDIVPIVMRDDERKWWRVAYPNVFQYVGQGATEAEALVAALEAFGGQRITMINDTTRDAIKRALAEGVRAGEGAEALGRRIRDVFATASRSRAVTIARTEVLRSSNWGATAAYRATGLVERREWLATPDGRTRDSHMTMDGVIVDIDAKFILRSGPHVGSEGDHPGGFNIPAEDIRCRCFTAPVVDDEVRDAEARTKLWKAADEDATKWEGAAIHAFRAGFREQERDVLDALGMVFGEVAA